MQDLIRSQNMLNERAMLASLETVEAALTRKRALRPLCPAPKSWSEDCSSAIVESVALRTRCAVRIELLEYGSASRKSG